MAALSFSGAAVIERQVEGTEVAVGLVGSPGEALPAVEIVPKGGVYDYAARYTAGATDYFAPARLGDDVAAACRDAAMAAGGALGLRDVTRVDMIVDGDGEPWVLEVNVSPGMTETQPAADGAPGRGDVAGPSCVTRHPIGQREASQPLRQLTRVSRARARGPIRRSRRRSARGRRPNRTR